MEQTHLERMIRLADDVFSARTDPEQLDVDADVIERLRRIHPETVSEHTEGDGPVAWVILIPTTGGLMQLFLQGEISEKDLYERTPKGVPYDAVYLCSALVLPEFRRKGLAKQMILRALEAMRHDHPVKALFVWAFSPEGDQGAASVAASAGLPLYRRQGKNQH
jgi:GNAT superfamily N-acetyltransferase